MKINIFKGDDDWVLSGISLNLESELNKLGIETQYVIVTDRGFSIKHRNQADYHLFPWQGFLKAYVNYYGNENLDKSVVLCTHYDASTFDVKLLNKCKLLIFQSSLQMATAIANGINLEICHQINYGVNNILHGLYSSNDQLIDVLKILGADWLGYHRKIVGFCGRYKNKGSYPARKNYKLISDLTCELVAENIPVLFLGNKWNELLPEEVLNSSFVRTVSTSYKNYSFFYNLMSVLISPSFYEAGPIPVLEAMSCGVYPIATKTGFVPDVITSEYIGKTMPIFSKVSDYMTAINLYLNNITHDQRVDIRKESTLYSYERLAIKINRLLE